ncbi:N-acetylglutamate synthase, mitochondrial [Arapaima gigas]
MAAVKRAAPGCRAAVMAGQLLSKPLEHERRHRRPPAAPRRHTAFHGAAKPPGRTPASAQPELVPRDVRTFLSEIGGDPREARYWFTHFQKAALSQSPAFAVIEASCKSDFNKIQEMVQSLAFGLSFLQRMDMKPVVVMGWSPEEAPAAETTFSSSGGLARRCQTLAEALQSNSVTVTPFFSSEALLLAEDAEPGTSGDVVSVNAELLQWSLDRGTVPVVCPVGRSRSGRSVDLDSVEVTAAISRALQPLKVMFLNNWGGIRYNSHQVLGQVLLPADTLSLNQSPWLRPVERRRVRVIEQLLNQLPCESSAVITSGNTLLTELFSHKGASSPPVTVYSSLDGIDVERLLALINKSFEKRLKDDYIASLKDRLHSVYLSDGYTATAIVTKEPVSGGTPYLDKFVVSSSKQGQGAGQILWQSIKQDLDKLFWRSRTTNRINPWYFKHSDGSFTNGNWIVFWFGLSDIRESYELVEFAERLPDSFRETQPPPPPPAS